MESVTVDNHNERMMKATLSQLDSCDARDAVGKLLDQWKELLEKEGATNISIQMVYMDENKRVGVDRISVYTTQNDDGESCSCVDADGIVFETESPDETSGLYVSLCENTDIDIWDNCDEISDELDRIQTIELYPDTNHRLTIDVIRKK